MLTLEQVAELHRLIHDYSLSEYNAGFYNSQAYMRKEAGEADRKRCKEASGLAQSTEEALLDYIATLIDVQKVLKC